MFGICGIGHTDSRAGNERDTMKLTAADLAALLVAVNHMSGTDKVPMDIRVTALLASYKIKHELERLSIDVEIETV